MSFKNRIAFRFGRYIPWPLGLFLTYIVYRERASNPARAMRHESGRRPLSDAELLNRLEIHEACLQSEVGAFHQGLRGLAWDIRLITHPWGFRLEEIRVPVYLWHGTLDNMTPIQMAYYIASKINACKVTYCENEGHMLLFKHWRSILSQLTEYPQDQRG